MGKEAEGNQVCLVRKKYDATKLSYLIAEVREDYVELITEFAQMCGTEEVHRILWPKRLILPPP